ncbi:DUF4305 domain-containing protein [Bacillus lacus]|uniref:DUF4305 domain-containing protein n=1 Tax=Metabacillus lacus TaxID=1983721 RepID=A0A7X2IZP5_9BACI|nr:YdiK family protein [Metabacillus lacus]MRX72768.1 DUF4305 domain-containing protein [Metabacillus lacus]
MRTNPRTIALFYFAMGILFTYLAVRTGQNGLWSLPTILLLLVATFDFGVAIRMFALSRKTKSTQNK